VHRSQTAFVAAAGPRRQIIFWFCRWRQRQLQTSEKKPRSSRTERSENQIADWRRQRARFHRAALKNAEGQILNREIGIGQKVDKRF